MLKPQRKITRKEIKRDPFLETIDKIEYNFEQNKKTYLWCPNFKNKVSSND